MSDLIPVFGDRYHPNIVRMLEKALGCLQCGAEVRALKVMSEKKTHPRYLLRCINCGNEGPYGHHIEDAVTQWNKPPSLFSVFMKKWLYP